MDPRRRDKMKSEMKKAEDYLQAADLLHKNGLFVPSVASSYCSAFHASIAAFLTHGSPQVTRESFNDFCASLSKFSVKLDPFVVKMKEERSEWSCGADLDYTENEALLRLYQTRELFLEVKDFLRRVVKL